MALLAVATYASFGLISCTYSGLSRHVMASLAVAYSCRGLTRSLWPSFGGVLAALESLLLAALQLQLLNSAFLSTRLD